MFDPDSFVGFTMPDNSDMSYMYPTDWYDLRLQPGSAAIDRADHAAYPQSVVPAITEPALVWAALVLVLVLEFLCATLVLSGAWSMWRRRKGTSAEFRLAKRLALNGFGVGVVVRLFLFGTVGAAAFQMWQTEIGAASYNGAFQFTSIASSGLTLARSHREPNRTARHFC